MTELWERRDGRRLTHAAYEALGGVAGAIGRRADTVFAMLPPDQQAATPRLFGRLVCIAAAGEEGADTRQRIRLGGLDAAAHSAVEPFVKGRLLVADRVEPSADQPIPGADSAPTPDDPTTVEVAHEALIRTWERLKTWIKDDRAFLLWRQRLDFLMTEWEHSGRDSGALLRGAPLTEARHFARTRRDDLNDRERDFLARSESISRRSRYGLAAVAAVLLIATGVIGYFLYDAQRRRREQAALRLAEARGRVEALASAEVRAVPDILRQLGEDRRLVRDRLAVLAASSDTEPEGRRRRLHAALALLPDEPVRRRDELFDRLLQADARPEELNVIRQALRDHSHAAALTPQLWALLKPMGTELTAPQLRVAGALALFDPKSPRWEALGPPIAAKLVQENTLLIGGWREAFQPVSGSLTRPLLVHYGNHDQQEARALAYTLLFEFATQPGNPNQPEDLADLIAEADPAQFKQILGQLTDRRRAIARLASQLGAPARFDDALARRQGQVATALVVLGQSDRVWPLFKHTDDPGVRTELIHDLARFGADPHEVVRRLDREQDVSARRALILCLGEYPTDRLSKAERQALASTLERWYHDDPDPGVHGGIDWLLRQRWGLGADLDRLDKEWAGPFLPKYRDWYVNGQGQTFASVRGPVEFRMGSPENEADHSFDEIPHRKRIDRSFAIATKEVTVAQYAKSLKLDFGQNDWQDLEVASYDRWLVARVIAPGRRPPCHCHRRW